MRSRFLRETSTFEKTIEFAIFVSSDIFSVSRSPSIIIMKNINKRKRANLKC